MARKDTCPCGTQLQPLDEGTSYAATAREIATEQLGHAQISDLALAHLVHVAMVHDDWDHVPNLVEFRAAGKRG